MSFCVVLPFVSHFWATLPFVWQPQPPPKRLVLLSQQYLLCLIVVFLWLYCLLSMYKRFFKDTRFYTYVLVCVCSDMSLVMYWRHIFFHFTQPPTSFSQKFFLWIEAKNQRNNDENINSNTRYIWLSMAVLVFSCYFCETFKFWGMNGQ